MLRREEGVGFFVLEVGEGQKIKKTKKNVF